MMNRFAAGALAGLTATVPMPLAMIVLRRLLPTSDETPLPPEQITAETVEKTGAAERPDPGALRPLALAAHLGFGAAAGALYAPLAAPKRDLPPAARGVGYGLGVWAASYLGWLPGAGLLPHATEQPTRLGVMMGLSHVVWGGVLGHLTERWAGEE